MLVCECLNNCQNDFDCADHLKCGDSGSCEVPTCDPTCAANANCSASNHMAICACDVGYVGDPYIEGCKGKQSQVFNSTFV